MPQKILIDTDPGQDIDDLLAIWFALRRPELDVKGITTVTWPSDGRERLVRRLLRYLRRDDIPVAAGASFPIRTLSQEERDNVCRLDHAMNHRRFAEPHDPLDAPRGEDATDLIIRTVEAHPGEVILCCIAPLTNIAQALTRKPEIAGQIKAIYLMGGELALPRGEHNIAFDYEAAHIVLGAGVPVAMGTWSVTRQFTLSMDDDRSCIAAHSSLGKALADAMQAWHPYQNWKPGPVMYDLFPFAWIVDRACYTTRPMSVQVETQGRYTRGWTVAAGDRTHIEVTTAIDVPRVRKLYFDTVLS